tara:strand:- start:1525 stop:2862 length:1338 start_codon:yes stop_codon:yes gene_type:complete
MSGILGNFMHTFRDGRRNNRDQILSLAVLDNNRFISGDIRGILKIWDKRYPNYIPINDPDGGYPKFLVTRGNEPVYALAVFPDKKDKKVKKRFISGGESMNVQLWEIENPEEDNPQKLQTTMVKVLKQPHYVTSLAVLDNDRFIVGYQNGEIWIWDIDDGPVSKGHHAITKIRGFVSNEERKIRALAVLDDKTFISVIIDSVKKWEIEEDTIREVIKYEDSNGGMEDSALAVFPDKKHFIIGSSRSKNESRGWYHELDGSKSDEEVLEMLTKNGVFCIKRYNVDNEKIEFMYDQEMGPPTSLAVLDNNRFISGYDGLDRRIKLWGKHQKESLHIFDILRRAGGLNGVENLCAFPDGQHFVSSNGPHVRLWRVYERSLEPVTKTFFNNNLGNDPSNLVDAILGTREGEGFKDKGIRGGGKRRNKKSKKKRFNKKKYRKTRRKSRKI